MSPFLFCHQDFKILLLKSSDGAYVPVDVYVLESDESTGTGGVECVYMCVHAQEPHGTAGY